MVEDDPDSAQLAAYLLRAAGHVVVEAADGLEALEAVANGADPDVILMDLDMPRMDGWTATAKLREDPRFQNVPILAHCPASPETHDRSENAELDGWIPKPLSAYDFSCQVVAYARAGRSAERRIGR